MLLLQWKPRRHPSLKHILPLDFFKLSHCILFKIKKAANIYKSHNYKKKKIQYKTLLTFPGNKTKKVFYL